MFSLVSSVGVIDLVMPLYCYDVRLARWPSTLAMAVYIAAADDAVGGD